MGQDADAQVLDTNDPGGSICTRFSSRESLLQTRVARRADDADSQNTNDVEANNSVEDEAGNSGDGAAGVLDLASGESNHVRAGQGEGGVDDNLPNTEESARATGGVV